MKSLRQHLLAAGLVACFGAAAVAQTPAPAAAGGPGAPQMHAHRGDDPARMEQRRARMQERMAKRLDAFKQKLQITSGQESAWAAWTTAIKPGTPLQRPDRAEMAKLTTPERIDRMRAMRATRMAEMDKRADATKTFYAALNAEQKKTFDEAGMRFMRGGKGRGGHGRHHGGYGRG